MSNFHANPWDIQRTIMEMSGQLAPGVRVGIPEDIAVTSMGLLYLALVLEEGSELTIATCDALDAQPHDQPWVGACAHLRKCAASMEETAAAVRRILAHTANQPRVLLCPELAATIADGLTDLVVVTAGMAEAMGIPGAQCYTEVAASNLSKANPATGVIDKDPSGKWIKGSLYKSADLLKVVAPLCSPRAYTPAGTEGGSED